ncbi:type VI secretion system-associated FHA domain protein TagH [Pseudomonas gessardii]|uniref:type VI secretion system-associated FHA domain protein TagH n=1 Tax=Pseudomonas gessardii TaxID=78544 RepID=UPI001472FB4A|nr:type VI secretion system-associated FHA domain protein TagH [Pseudomonas gessardii]NNA67828.1 type VI secretion system-associated FHA domain protein TagH [Pseudomonas gessardii]NNA88167.1 type VI secretion system-associated FHA domain protein TagH [Pseudomonas gessardii]
MQLVFEVCGNGQGMPDSTRSKIFDGAGGVIGRGADCDWVIPDPSRQLSNHHALVSFRDDQYFLTDISTNGIRLGDGAVRLRKGQARPISQGMVLRMGPFDLRTQLLEAADASNHRDNLIPDDAFLQLDPVRALDDQQARPLPEPSRTPSNWADTSTVERHHVPVPTLVEPAVQVSAPVETTPPAHDHGLFWEAFAQALGVRLDPLDEPGRQALAIKVAGLLKQAIEGLQQNLHTHAELKSALGASLGQAPARDLGLLSEGGQALEAMLQGAGELMVTQAYRDLQVHQVALLAGCRAAMRGALAAFAPGQLLVRFEQQGNTPRIPTSGAYWRAYLRHYQRLVEDDDWEERLLNEDFANVYREQVRLVSTLHSPCSG